jgi:hypothetical protein
MEKYLVLLVFILLSCRSKPVEEKKVDTFVGEDEMILSLSKQINAINQENDVSYQVDSRRCTRINIDLVHKYSELPDSVLNLIKQFKNLYWCFSVQTSERKIPNFDLADNRNNYTIAVTRIDTINLNPKLKMFRKISSLRILGFGNDRDMNYESIDSLNNVKELVLGYAKIDDLQSLLLKFPRLEWLELKECSVKNARDRTYPKLKKLKSIGVLGIQLDEFQKHNPHVKIIDKENF